MPAPATFLRFVSHPIIIEFAAGIAIGYFYMRGFRISRHSGLFAGIAGLILLMTVPSFNDTIDQQRYIHYGIPAVLMVVASVYPIGFDQMRVNRAGYQIGEISYAIYLFHPFVIGATSVVFARFGLIGEMSFMKVIITYSVLVSPAIPGGRICRPLFPRFAIYQPVAPLVAKPGPSGYRRPISELFHE